MKRKQTKEKIRVMLVDDHAGLREALRKVINLEPDLEVSAEASGGRDALQLLSHINPDVVLMDGSMPEMNGIETTRRLKRRQPKAKIIGLTLYGESTYLEEMVAAGASGYLMKTGSPENVINAIRIVSKGGTYFDPAVPRRHQASVARGTSATEELTARELAVAKLLSNGLTNAEIAVSLDLKIPAVEAHRTAAFKKLGLRSRAGLVRVAAERHWLDA
jgi:DNA-binding NarL/FixJ family response regulator